MRIRTLATILSVAIAAPLLAGDQTRPRKPRLELRATPRMAFSPVVVLATAELRGGDELEDFYCPALEWHWDDGGSSSRESDCPPFEPGIALDRRFTAEHVFRGAGMYTVKITLRRANRALAVATTTVHIHSRLGVAEASAPD
jgi:hypothetical protein